MVYRSTEYARFEKQVGDKKRGDKYNRSAEGLLIIPTGDEQGIENVLVYTDAKHGNPSIEKVVIIDGEYETILADIRKDIYYDEKQGAQDLIVFYEREGIITTYTAKDYPLNSEQRRRESTDGKDGRNGAEELDTGNRKNSAKYSLKDSNGRALTKGQAELNDPPKMVYRSTKNGEHAHDYEWDEEGKLKNKTKREINEKERKDNGDIL